MSDTETSPATLLYELAGLDPQVRRDVATVLRQVSDTLAELPDGKTASYVLGVFAHVLDPVWPVPKTVFGTGGDAVHGGSSQWANSPMHGRSTTVGHFGEGLGHTAKGRRHFAAFLRIEGCQFVKERRWRHLLDRPRLFHLRQTTAA